MNNADGDSICKEESGTHCQLQQHLTIESATERKPTIRAAFISSTSAHMDGR
jgi:hypothetical protein